MTTARDIMTSGAEFVETTTTVLEAAKKLASENIGALPICGNDDRLKGMLTDRDIVVKVLAAGKDPGSTKAGELAEGKPVTIGADDSVQVRLCKDTAAVGLPACVAKSGTEGGSGIDTEKRAG